MPPPDRKLTEKELRSLERTIRREDPLQDKLGLRSHYGSIEAAEEKRFPWLRQRRRGR